MSARVGECITDSLTWSDLGATGKSDFTETCRSEWGQERADLSPSFLALALDACEDTTVEVRELDCDVLINLYAVRE